MELLCPIEPLASSSGGLEVWGCKAGSGAAQVQWGWERVQSVTTHSSSSPCSRHLQVPEDGAAETGFRPRAGEG